MEAITTRKGQDKKKNTTQKQPTNEETDTSKTLAYQSDSLDLSRKDDL